MVTRSPLSVRLSVRRLLTALLLCGALLAGTTACGSDSDSASATKATSSASATTKAEKQKFAKTRFAANAGLAAGATYQWIVKPYRAGKFKAGADGRRFALIKAGLAGAFTYNRLKAATRNAEGDPTLSKAVGPLSAGIASLKGLSTKLRKGEGLGDVTSSFDDVINNVKDAGRSAGAEVTNKVPSASQLSSGS
ncbi:MULTISPECIES: hypothetical protein [unclassified Streptomyces]|uniref:hypothetical protein n=1 Tax=unclassified Streptomyces TaxID=2593676 RepID=UPI00278C07B4|nr:MULTISPECIES: hypothetical protein [unclassified Streptomyces]